MMYINIDEDDDYANDIRKVKRPRREAAALMKTRREEALDYAGDERSVRRLRRHSSLKDKYLQNSCNRKERKKEADENYAFFLNFYMSKDEDDDLGFQDTINVVETDADPQYERFLNYLKPCKTSYVLDIVKADGTSDSFTYEHDDMSKSDQPKHTTNRNNSRGQENNAGRAHHISGNVLDDRKRKGFDKFTDKPSETLGRLASNDKMSIENAGHPESLKVGAEFTHFKLGSTESMSSRIDVSYQFHLAQKFNLKLGKKHSSPLDSHKSNVWSADETATKKTLRKHKLGSKDHSGHIFDGDKGKKPRHFRDSGKGAKMTMSAKDVDDPNGDPKHRMNDFLRQKMEGKHEGKTSHCQNSGNKSQRTDPDKAFQKDVGVQAPNDRRHKRHRPAEDWENSARRSVPVKVDPKTNGSIPLRETPEDKFGKNHIPSGYSEKTTKRTLADSIAEDDNENDLRALHGSGNQSSGKNSRRNNHNQPREIKVEGWINDSYKTFLIGLSVKEGKPVFQSGGKVVTYEKGLTSDTDSDSDSDSVLIIGDSVNGITDRKHYSTMPRKSDLQDSKIDKSRASRDSFKKKLMNILLRPYDHNEYESLMELAKKRRHLTVHKDLRKGREGTFELESLGKSYLDHHKDVAEAIKRCRGDCQKVLTVLRGFMFWLQHVASAGAFKPWRYKEYLEVQPQMTPC